MKKSLALVLGVAVAVVAVAAQAQTERNTRMFIRHGGDGEFAIDADQDGWITRAEASAAADRAFERMDQNRDGKLDREDRGELAMFDVQIDNAEVEGLEGEDLRIEIRREIERAHQEAAQALDEARREAQEARREAQEAGREAQRAERDVVIIRNGERVEWVEGAAPVAPVAPVPPVPPLPPIAAGAPMFIMLFANSEEADRNGDGSLSAEEFRAQHLRFFDASDANGDGRVRASPVIAPPAPRAPEAPRAPAPPARR